MLIAHPESAAFQPAQPAVASSLACAVDPQALQEQFEFMRGTFASSGGMLSADALAARGELRGGNGIGIVARWIVSRRVISVHWLGSYWIPAFQFSTPTLRLHESMAEVLIELCPLMDDWCLALWFASANGWLAGACPADAWRCAPQDVWHAARAQRFALCG